MPCKRTDSLPPDLIDCFSGILVNFGCIIVACCMSTDQQTCSTWWPPLTSGEEWMSLNVSSHYRKQKTENQKTENQKTENPTDLLGRMNEAGSQVSLQLFSNLFPNLTFDSGHRQSVLLFCNSHLIHTFNCLHISENNVTQNLVSPFLYPGTRSLEVPDTETKEYKNKTPRGSPSFWEVVSEMYPSK